MNPYEAPRARLGGQPPDTHRSWLDPHLRRAMLLPPLIAAPAAGAVLFLLGEAGIATSLPGWIVITLAAYLAQLIYGAPCYVLLHRLRWLNPWSILAVSQLPFVIGALAYDPLTVAVYSISALAVALASAYFLFTPSGGR